MTPRDRLRAHVMDSVAKSGSGAVLVSAGEVAALFADFDALAARVTHPEGDLPLWYEASMSLDRFAIVCEETAQRADDESAHAARATACDMRAASRLIQHFAQRLGEPHAADTPVPAALQAARKCEEERAALPPLPDGLASNGYRALYTAEQMYEYARAARASNPARLALDALDGRSEGDPPVLVRIEAVAALLQVTESPEAFVEAWAEDPEAMRETLSDARELVRKGRLALASSRRVRSTGEGGSDEA